MNDRDERGSDVLAGADEQDDDVLADAHEQDADVTGDELGGGLGNTADGGANDG
jgi:hypothetical protein